MGGVLDRGNRHVPQSAGSYLYTTTNTTEIAIANLRPTNSNRDVADRSNRHVLPYEHYSIKTSIYTKWNNELSDRGNRHVPQSAGSYLYIPTKTGTLIHLSD